MSNPAEQTTEQTPDDVQRLTPVAPKRIGRYEIQKVLGFGAFGRVYEAFDPDLERAVAIKTPILPPGSQREFLREARAIADIHHPHICPVYDVGQHDGLPYIVMRYVKGGTLDTLLASASPAPADALRFAEQIAKGLEATHACGIIHRDLKPANVLFDEAANTLLIADFGLARWSEQTTASAGGIKGTPVYMAPEQWGPGGPFGDVSARTDVYSLGVILFRLLTGIQLFPGTTAPEQMSQHCFTDPRRVSQVRPDLAQFDDLCRKALAKQPSDRYASAKAFAVAIADCLRPPAAPTRPASSQPVRDDEADRIPWTTVASPPLPAVPVPPRERKWQVTVPGTWYRRPAGNANTEWEEVVETPAEVMTQSSEVYRLNVSSRA